MSILSDYDPYLEEHHPTCKGGCGQLADECMCNWVWPPAEADTLVVEIHDEQE